MSSSRIKSSYNSWKVALIFLFPFMLFYGIFTLYPLFDGFVMSFHEGRFGIDEKFVAFSNYTKMFQDKNFYIALKNTLFFVMMSSPLVVVFGLTFAIISNSRLRAANFVKISTFLPYVLSISVISSVWIYIFKPYIGLLNSILTSSGIISEQILWFDSSALAWTTITVATIWWTVGFNMILLMAGLHDIPSSLYEASSIDGANKVQQFLYITIPSLSGVLKMVILLQIISSFKLFGQPWLMTGGGPGNSTTPLVQYIYETGFRDWDSGYASTLSYTLLFIMVVVALAYSKITNSKEV